MYDYAYFKKPTYAATANSANQQVATATPSAYVTTVVKQDLWA